MRHHRATEIHFPATIQQRYRAMLAVFVTILSLTSVGHSAPLACEKLVRPLVQLDLHDLAGRWALVSGSMKHGADNLSRRDSVTIDFYNSSYTQINNFGDECRYHPRNFSVEGQNLKVTESTFNLTVTFFHTDCADCALFTLNLESPHYNSKDFILLSKRRQLEQKEMEEFRAQVECLNMPPPVVMDPTKDLCPEKKTSDPEDQTEKKA